MCTGGRPWRLFKDDQEASYNHLPIRLADRMTAIIALRHPISNDWFGFKARTLIYGSTAAVLRYNCFARSISTIATIVLGIPPVSYFDDFAALMPAELDRAALDTFARFCELLRISLKCAKSEVGPQVTFLGLRGNFPSGPTRFRMGITLRTEKRQLGPNDQNIPEI